MLVGLALCRAAADPDRELAVLASDEIAARRARLPVFDQTGRLLDREVPQFPWGPETGPQGNMRDEPYQQS